MGPGITIKATNTRAELVLVLRVRVERVLIFSGEVVLAVQLLRVVRGSFKFYDACMTQQIRDKLRAAAR